MLEGCFWVVILCRVIKEVLIIKVQFEQKPEKGGMHVDIWENIARRGTRKCKGSEKDHA